MGAGPVGAARAAAEQALAELFCGSYRRLVTQLYAFTTDLTEAQDVAQEAFARALARPRELAEVDCPEAWLRTVAINVVRRRWRRRKILDAIMLRDRPTRRPVESAPGPERADPRDALARLPRAHREVIVLHHLADLPVDGVAELLSIPIGTVTSRLSRGRAALAADLDGYPTEGSPMPEHDDRLGAARAELLNRIAAADVTGIRIRVAALRRRRRRWTVASAAAACLAVIATGVVSLDVLTDRPGRQPLAATAPPTGPQIWRGGGLTLRGLTGNIADLPGRLTDVEFADARHGYALAASCPAVPGIWCRLSFATTEDGGLTWVTRPAPVSTIAAAAVPTLVPVGSDGLVAAGETMWFRRAGQDGWQVRTYPTNPPVQASILPGARLRQRGDGCASGPVEVWQPDGWLARLAEQPAMNVCWVATVPAADGSWWVGGRLATDAGTPAVAVTRDGGRSWQVKTFGSPELADAWVEVSTLGGEAFATVLRPRTDGRPGWRVHGIYRLRPGADAFEPYGDGLALGTLVGDLVPLLDGRLVAASPDWMVSHSDGTGFRPAGGSMPWVGRLHRTGAGWIAEDLFASGWAALSSDGQTWRRLQVR